MLALDKLYASELDKVKEEVQASDALAQYLDEEEESFYLDLRNQFEPKLLALYEQVAKENPLQLMAFEQYILDEGFEGLFLPKILGYAVLRGDLNENYKYLVSQDQFSAILLAICNSANFEILSKRIGQTVQLGFALSSDIWVTSLVEKITNKRVKSFLMTQKMPQYRVFENRRALHFRYNKQFSGEIFGSAVFPKSFGEFKVMHLPLRNFLLERAMMQDVDNSSILPHMNDFLKLEEIQGNEELIYILMIFGKYFEYDKDIADLLSSSIDTCIKEDSEFDIKWFAYLDELYGKGVEISADNAKKSLELVGAKSDLFNRYYQLIHDLSVSGVSEEKIVEEVRAFHSSYEGLSKQNVALRTAVYRVFEDQMNGLKALEYSQFFTIFKQMVPYVENFRNQRFNQNLKDLFLKFVKRCIKIFTDKRGRDYQDVKKFVATNFVDIGFMKDKEVVALFKTKRKKKA
jgi:hypothetical protein